MAVAELLIGAVIGLAVGVFCRPLTASLERKMRRIVPTERLIIHVEDNPAIIWSGFPDWIEDAVYIDDPLRLRGEIPSGRDDWAAWLRSQNAVDANRTTLSVVLQARTEAAVVIESVLVKLHRVVSIDNGAILIRGVGGASVNPRRFKIDLDSGNPPPAWLEGGHEVSAPWGITLAAGETEVFHIWAEARQSFRYEWTFDLNLIVEGQREIESIARPDGSPFVTVGGGDLPAWINYSGSSVWQYPSEAEVDKEVEG
jgi:hypothetical protein